MSIAGKARHLATAAHAGQVDKAGDAYIGHPRRVAQRVAGAGGSEFAVAVAWLHDVVEDTPVTLDDLRACGFPGDVIDAVQAITHLSHEPRADYYARVRRNALALEVKRADVEDNSDPARLARLDRDTATRLRQKYAYAREALAP